MRLVVSKSKNRRSARRVSQIARSLEELTMADQHDVVRIGS